LWKIKVSPAEKWYLKRRKTLICPQSSPGPTSSNHAAKGH
jgi:hypothetical protein